MNKQNIITHFLDKGFLVSPDFLEGVDYSSDSGTEAFFKILEKLENQFKNKESPFILTKDLLFVLQSLSSAGSISEINWFEFEKSRVFLEKGKNSKIYDTFLDILNYNVSKEKKRDIDKIVEQVSKPEDNLTAVEKLGKEEGLNNEKGYSNAIVLKNYIEEDKKREVNDFVFYFRNRYEKLRKMLQGRVELQNVISISRVLEKREKEKVSIIGMVLDKHLTKNGNFIIALEDNTGAISCLARREDKEIFEIAKDLVVDEVVGICGVCNEKFIFCSSLLVPGFRGKDVKKINEDVCVVFTADLHFGNKCFLSEKFLKFIDWLNCKSGDVETARKVKYLFIVGDIVDGIGIFPNQEEELAIKDIYLQYEKCAELLSKIRKDIQIVICAGNHDALRISEPQPVLDRKIAKPLWELPNIVMVTNPSLVNIHSSKEFDGFDVLLYHGYSFHYFANYVDSIKSNGGINRTDLIMKFLLERRHLAPSHASTLYIPDTKNDNLIIEKVPDFFITAHIHNVCVANYKGVTMASCGCWIPTTPYMEKFGFAADPSKVCVVNLKTREHRIIEF